MPGSRGKIEDMPSSDTQFKKGQKKTGGRGKGVRGKITKKYLEFLLQSLDGPEDIEKIKKDKPEVWVKLLAMLVPKDLDINHTGNVSIRVVDYAEDDNGL